MAFLSCAPYATEKRRKSALFSLSNLNQVKYCDLLLISSWISGPAVVNAFYSPFTNQICNLMRLTINKYIFKFEISNKKAFRLEFFNRLFMTRRVQSELCNHLKLNLKIFYPKALLN